MRKTWTVITGALAGVLVATIGLMIGMAFFRSDSSSAGPTARRGSVGATSAAGEAAASALNGTSPEIGASSGAPLRLVPIYQRALTDELTLKSVEGQVVWVESVAQRAQQIARLVIDGFPSANDVVSPAGNGVTLRAVFLDDRGTAWVDLDAASLTSISGSDEEESLVAAISRSLTEGLHEVNAVGFLVDGAPRETLAGHVDISRRFTGREWGTRSDSGAAAPLVTIAPGTSR